MPLSEQSGLVHYMFCCLRKNSSSHEETTWSQLLSGRGTRLWEMRHDALTDPVVILPLNGKRKQFVKVFCGTDTFLYDEINYEMDKFADTVPAQLRSLTETAGSEWAEHRAILQSALKGIKELSLKAAEDAEIRDLGFEPSKVDMKAMIQNITLQWAVRLFYGKYDEEFASCFFDFFQRSRALKKDEKAALKKRQTFSVMVTPEYEESIIAKLFDCGFDNLSAANNCINAMSAAYDATFSLIFFTIWNLAKNENLWNEAQNFVFSADDNQKANDLKGLADLKELSTAGETVHITELSFLARALTETLRVYPPVWTLPRNCRRSTEISSKLDVLAANNATERKWNPNYDGNELQITSFGVGKRSCPAGTAALIASYRILHRFIKAYDRPVECIPDNAVHSIYLGPTLCMEGPQFFLMQRRNR